MRKRTLVVYLLACLIAFVVLAGLFYAPGAPTPTPVPTPPPTTPTPPPTTPTPTPTPAPPSPGAPSTGVGLATLSAIVPYVPLIGAIGAVWKYTKDWREQVVLGINDITVKTHSYYFGNTYINEPTYCLRVQNRRRNGRGESCEGRINVKGADIDHSTVWADNNQRYIPISLVADLLLFRVSKLNNESEIIFVVASGSDGDDNAEIRKPFSEYAGRTLSVRIGSANAHVPKTYRKTIEKIVQTSV